MKLELKKNMSFENIVVGYADSDWGRNEINRKSTTGFLFKIFNQCCMCWNTKRQYSEAASSTEAVVLSQKKLK